MLRNIDAIMCLGVRWGEGDPGQRLSSRWHLGVRPDVDAGRARKQQLPKCLHLCLEFFIATTSCAEAEVQEEHLA